MLARRATEVWLTTMLTWSRRMVTGTTSDEQTALSNGDLTTQDAGGTSRQAAVAQDMWHCFGMQIFCLARMSSTLLTSWRAQDGRGL